MLEQELKDVKERLEIKESELRESSKDLFTSKKEY